MDQRRIFRFLTERIGAGQPCALVTVLAVEGSAMRNPGTHMAVAADGSFVGSLSGGCIENAVVAEACDALKAGAVRIVRFGAGSPYLDIRLPCGGGLDIHFQPLADAALPKACLAASEARQPFTVAVDPAGCTAGLAGMRRPSIRGKARPASGTGPRPAGPDRAWRGAGGAGRTGPDA